MKGLYLILSCTPVKILPWGEQFSKASIEVRSSGIYRVRFTIIELRDVPVNRRFVKNQPNQIDMFPHADGSSKSP